NGEGLCLIDPHEELYENVLEWCAYFRPQRKIIPLNLSRGNHVIGFNPFVRGPANLGTQVERCLEAMVKAWGADNTDELPRIDRVLGALVTAIIEADDLTLCEADYFTEFNQSEVRQYLTSRIQEPLARGNWRDLGIIKRFEEFNSQVESSRNRLGRFLRAEVTRRFFALTDPLMNLDIAKIMDEGAVLLVNVKESDWLTVPNQRLFGTLLVNAFIDTAKRRHVGGDHQPPPFRLYLDEFHNFVSADIGKAVTQVRKFGLTFTLAHQTLHQVDQEDASILSELMGAVKARAVFGGLSYEDAIAIVPDLFPGQLDLLEVKYMEYINEWWPVYSRDKVYTEGEADVTGSASMSGQSDTQSMGGTTPDGFLYNQSGGSTFDSSGWGRVSAETHAESHVRSRIVADIPIFIPERHVREVPHHYNLEEQVHRQAERLMLQYQRHCFIRPPNGRARPLLVPFVERYALPEANVRAYEAEMANQAGALTPEDVDRISEQRRLKIETGAREFAVSGDPLVELIPDHEPIIPLKPGRRKKTPAKGTGGTEG
ncbi:MAG: type IV secretory system conjugative DNA transfer family protein, partial [Burkholderiales bacterium]